MDIQTLAAAVRNIPDFPEKGIQFKDITTLFQSGEYLSSLSDIMYERYKERSYKSSRDRISRFFMGPA